jgi:hypothetical protein
VVLVVTLLFAVAAYISFTLLGPVYEVQMAEQMRQMQEANPEMTAEQLQGVRSFGRVMMILTAVVSVPLVVLVLGLLLWIGGKMVSAEQPLSAAFLVVAFSWMPRVLEAILSALQAFVLDVNAQPSMYAVSFSPARFMDPETSTAVLLMMTRLSPFILWSYVLIAIGLKVTGRVSTGKAALVAALLWLLGSLPTVVPALAAG